MFQTATGNITITKIQYPPLTRVPLTNRMQPLKSLQQLGPPAGSSSSARDTILTVEPVANADYANAVGELSGGGISSLNEEEMGTLTQEIEEPVPKKALSNKSR